MSKMIEAEKLNHPDEPATVPGPAIYEEELKDYSDDSEDEPPNNLPEKHPEPAPEKFS